MKAVVKRSSKPFDLAIQEVPFSPQLKTDEVLVKIHAAGICGSDLHMYAGHSGYDWVPYPLILGHEITGTVEKVGSPEQNSLINRRVVINPYLSCGHCHYCQLGEENCCDHGKFFPHKQAPLSLQYGFRQNGGMAEYIKVPATNVYPVPDSLSIEVAAIIEAIAVGTTAIRSIEEIENKKILLFGPGPIGLGIASLLIGLGAAQITMVGTAGDEQRLQKALELGVDQTVQLDPSDPLPSLHKLAPHGFDTIIDSSGHPSVPYTAVPLMKKQAELIFVGISTQNISLPMDQVVRGELRFRGSYGITRETLRQTIEYASNPKFPFSSLICNLFSLDEAHHAFEAARKQAAGKVILINEE